MITKQLVILFCAAIASQCTPAQAAYDQDKLIAALIQVESNGKDSAIGDGGLAHGPLQIHPIMVEECNRLVYKSGKFYTLADRHNRAKSIEMCKVYLNRYAPPATATAEQASRKWNGGPRGDQKKSTLKYWQKVKTVLLSNN